MADTKRPRYSYYLGDSAPGSSITIKKPLTLATDRTLDLVLDSNGTAKFNFPLNHPTASLISEITSCIVVAQDGDFIWSGPVMDTEEDLAAKNLSVTAVGWLEELELAFVQPGQTDALIFDAVDQGLIAFSLLAAANSRRDLTGSSDVWPTKITQGSADESVARTRTYAVDQSIGRAISDLSEVEDGFDYYVDPITRNLEIRWPRIGSVREKLNFGFGVGPQNLTNVVIQRQGSAVRTRTSAHGQFAVGVDEAFQQMELYGMRENHISLSDVADSTILGAYAIGETRITRDPKESYTLTLRAHAPSVPIFGRDFSLGDTGFLSASGGRKAIVKVPQRIFGISLEIDDLGYGNIKSINTSL